MMHGFIFVRVRWRQVAISLLMGWLAACSAAGPVPAFQQDHEGGAAPAVANRAPSGGSGLECNVSPDSNQAQYIIGYGSLMQDDSRKRTSPQARPAHPVEVTGYRRGWFARSQAAGFTTTYLGAVPDREGYFNAVIYEVDPEELFATDRRERSYCRTRVASTDIEFLEREVSLAPDGQAWIYVNGPGSIATPDSRHPIVQSYVDIFVSGCLEQEQRFGLADFSRRCLSTTTDWSEHWVNDRIYPRRPFVFQPQAGQIDTLLSRQLGKYFSHIRIESGG